MRLWLVAGSGDGMKTFEIYRTRTQRYVFYVLAETREEAIREAHKVADDEPEWHQIEAQENVSWVPNPSSGYSLWVPGEGWRTT